MRVHSVIKLALSRIFRQLPAFEHATKLWIWWITRKMILYGTCIYVAETIFGQRRRPLGSNPVRLMGYSLWLPKCAEKTLDEESRVFLKHLGYKIPISAKRKLAVSNSNNNPIINTNQFYADVPFKPPLITIDDEDPKMHIEGQTYPLGFSALKKTLRVLGHFPAKNCVKIWKSCEVVHLKKGRLACDFAEVDNNFLVVVEGILSVSIEDDQFGHVIINSIGPNEHAMSIFVLANHVLGGRVQPKPLRATAEMDSVVLKISYESLKNYFWEDAPQDLVPFLCRMLTKLRGLYFEGLAELAGLGKNIIVESLAVSKVL